MPGTSSDITQRWAELLVEELVRLGVDCAAIGPGSRSTPLVAACVRHPGMSVRLHVDERGAAFFALGRARATGRPGLWITTSGTAAANGLPAVAEASVDGVPLVLLTADRPPELRDTAANQTIPQPGIFGSYVRWQVDLPVPDPFIDPAYLLTTVDQAVFRATGTHPGPVHVNAMFRKPLEPTSATAAKGPERWELDRGPYTRYALTGAEPDVGPLAEALGGAERPLILAGRLTAAEADAVTALARVTDWPVLADILSQLRLGPGDVVRHGALVAPHAGGLPRPDAIIEVGRPGVSTRLRDALLEAAPRVHAVIADGPARIDPGHTATHRVQGVVSALRALSDARFGSGRRWADPWLETDRRIALALEARFTDGDLSELSAAWHLATLLRPDQGVFVASSLPVRHLDAFAGPGLRPRIVAANRGASGIDGTIATAAGLCDGLGAPVIALVGDLALLHDLNSLALLRDRRVTVVVLNNDGGGIFSFLPIAGHADLLEPWFAAPHGLSFGPAAELFGLAYRAPDDVRGYRDALEEAAGSDRSTIVEVRARRTDTRDLHDEVVREAGGIVGR